MFILLHGGYPGYIIKRHDLESEVLVIIYFFDFLQESGEVGGGDAVYVG
jgi:hypothetical protein